MLVVNVYFYACVDRSFTSCFNRNGMLIMVDCTWCDQKRVLLTYPSLLFVDTKETERG